MSGFRLAAALALFVALAVAAGLPISSRVDYAITVWLQRAAPVPDAPAAALSLMGDPEVIIPGLAVGGLVLLLLHNKRHGRGLLWLAAGTVGVSLLGVTLQDVIVHPAPPVALTRYIARRGLVLGDPAVIFPGLAAAGLALLFLRDKPRGREFLWLVAGILGISLVAVAAKHMIAQVGRHMLEMIGLYPVNGFPSGHTMRMTLLAGTALRRVPMLAAALVIGMVTSLVYLGVHWTSEVLGGFCLGWACVEIAREVWRQLG